MMYGTVCLYPHLFSPNMTISWNKYQIRSAQTAYVGQFKTHLNI